MHDDRNDAKEGMDMKKFMMVLMVVMMVGAAGAAMALTATAGFT